jgi:predicted acylesterase/phospholipase RssA/CRP-like cAMP-binding protein
MRQALKAIPLFKELANEDLDLIASSLKRISYAKGQTIFRQGDIGDAMFLVESGQVIVWDEKEAEALAYLGRGSFVGEIALLLAEPRSASLKVALDADLYVLEKRDFDQLINERPAIAIQMTRELSQRLVNTTQQRFKSQFRRISALWGTDYAQLIETINRHLKKSIAIIPLEGCPPPKQVEHLTEVMILEDLEVTIENLAGILGVQVEVFGHIFLLLPAQVSVLGRRALALADTVISIGETPQWVTDNVASEKIWQSTNDAQQLSRIARRLSGHTVGLALSSGGGKGFAHLGVLKVLKEENIPVDIIAGTSAGAFFSIPFILGWKADHYEDFVDEVKTLNRITNWDINWPIPRSGILKGIKAKDLIARLVENKQFDELDIPFYCVAANVLTGTEEVFHSGDIANAIRASLSIPGLANPWKIQDQYFIDGAFVNPIPARLLRERGADIVIASSVIQPLVDPEQDAVPVRDTSMPHFLKIITNIQSMVEERLVKTQMDDISVMIHTKVRVDHALDFESAHNIMAEGEAAARGQLLAINACLEKSPNEQNP